MSGNGEYNQSLEGIKAAMAARSVMKDWTEGTELIEVVWSTRQIGWNGRCGTIAVTRCRCSCARVPHAPGLVLRS